MYVGGIMVSYTEKVEEYANEMPAELRSAIYALSDDLPIAIFLLLFKSGKQSQEQISNMLNMPSCFICAVETNLKILQKSALISSTCENGLYYYDVTEFGERVLKNLMNTLSTEG